MRGPMSLSERGLTFVSTINPTFGRLAESALGQVPCLEEESRPRSCSVSCLPQTLRACGFCDTLPGPPPPHAHNVLLSPRLGFCTVPSLSCLLVLSTRFGPPGGLVPLVEQPRFWTNIGIVSHSLHIVSRPKCGFCYSCLNWVQWTPVNSHAPLAGYRHHLHLIPDASL